MATSPLVSALERTESGQAPYAALPLHRRFRFWLPLLGIIPPLLAASAGTFNFDQTPGNLVVYGLYLAAEPFTDQQTIVIALVVAFWYAVGVALDRRRFNRPYDSVRMAGWLWVLGAFALLEAVRLASHEGSDFADQYLSVLLSADPAVGLARLPAVMRFNYLFVSEAVPVLAAVPWVLVVIRIAALLRMQRIAAAPRRRPVLPYVRVSALALTILLTVALAPESHTYRVPLVLVPFLLLPAAKALAGKEWSHIRRSAFSTAAALTCFALFNELAFSLSQAPAAAKLGTLENQGDSSTWYHIHYAFLTARRLLGLLLAFSLVLCYRDWLFPGFRMATPTPSSLRSWLLKLKPVHYVALAIVAVIGLSVARQDTDSLERLIAYGGLFLAIRLCVPTTSRYRWILYGGVLSFSWWYIAGSYEPERDLFLAGATFAACYVGWMIAERYEWGISQSVAALTFFLAVWSVCSAGDAFLPGLTPFPTVQTSSAHRRPESRSRFQMLRPAYAGEHVGVALSGGGYRAAVVQAGALVALESLRIPITHIAAVSGGSIIGSYYALGGDPYQFAQAVSFRQFNTTRDILDIQNATRLLLATPLPGSQLTLLPGYRFSRTEVQANALDRVVIHGSLFGGLPRGAPRLMLCTSDLRSGSALGITSSWTMTRFLLAPPGQDVFADPRRPREPQIVSRPSTFELRPADQVKLSLLVSASGAFPLAFEPVSWTTPHGSFLMTDGGVSDNSAMTLLLEADRRAGLEPAKDGKPQGDPNWALNLAIAVDGGAMFERDYSDFSSVDAGRRAVDLIQSRLGATKPAEARGEHAAVAPIAVWLSPSLYMDNSSPYDYGSIGQRVGVDVQNGEDSFTDDLLETGAYAAEEQQLFNRVASQIVQLDLPSLEVFLQNLVGVVHAYAEPLKRLQANWITNRELRLLETHANGEHVDAGVLNTINEKRRQRVEALKLIAYRVAADLSNGLGTFVSTPTLDDFIDVRQATALFRLGQYLAFLKAADLRTALAGPTEDPSRYVTPAEQANVRCTIEAMTKYAGRGDYAPDTESANLAEERQRRFPRANAAFNACLERAATDPGLRSDVAEVWLHTLSTSGHY